MRLTAISARKNNAKNIAGHSTSFSMFRITKYIKKEEVNNKVQCTIKTKST